MILTLTKQGGFAAAIQHTPQSVDTRTLPTQATAELTRLVAAAKTVPPSKDSGRGRDSMSFTITIDDGAESTALNQSDMTMSPAFAALLTWLERHLKPK